MEKNLPYEIFGWIGTSLVLAAYGLNSLGFLGADSAAYQVMNIIGSAGLLSIALIKKVYQSVAINIVWAFIGMFALWKILFA